MYLFIYDVRLSLDLTFSVPHAFFTCPPNVLFYVLLAPHMPSSELRKCLLPLVGQVLLCFFFQAEDGIRDLVRSRGLGDVYKRQNPGSPLVNVARKIKIAPINKLKYILVPFNPLKM